MALRALREVSHLSHSPWDIRTRKLLAYDSDNRVMFSPRCSRGRR